CEYGHCNRTTTKSAKLPQGTAEAPKKPRNCDETLINHSAQESREHDFTSLASRNGHDSVIQSEVGLCRGNPGTKYQWPVPARDRPTSSPPCFPCPLWECPPPTTGSSFRGSSTRSVRRRAATELSGRPRTFDVRRPSDRPQEKEAFPPRSRPGNHARKQMNRQL